MSLQDILDEDEGRREKDIVKQKKRKRFGVSKKTIVLIIVFFILGSIFGSYAIAPLLNQQDFSACASCFESKKLCIEELNNCLTGNLEVPPEQPPAGEPDLNNPESDTNP